MIYTHVLNRGPAGVRSPVDGLRNGIREFYTDPHKTPRQQELGDAGDGA